MEEGLAFSSEEGLAFSSEEGEGLQRGGGFHSYPAAGFTSKGNYESCPHYSDRAEYLACICSGMVIMWSRAYMHLFLDATRDRRTSIVWHGYMYMHLCIIKAYQHTGFACGRWVMRACPIYTQSAPSEG